MITLPAGAAPEGLVLTTEFPGGLWVPTTVNPSLCSSRSAWGKLMPTTLGMDTSDGELEAVALAVRPAGVAAGEDARGELDGDTEREPVGEAKRDVAGDPAGCPGDDAAAPGRGTDAVTAGVAAAGFVLSPAAR